jgi:hypothetical protein
MSLNSPRHPVCRAGLRSRAGWIGAALLFILVVIVGIGAYMRHEYRKQEAAKKRRIFASQADPRSALESYFLNTQAPFDLKRPDWKVLVDYTSSEDLNWLNNYVDFLAAENASLDARPFGGSPPERLQYDALTMLYNNVGMRLRPVITNGIATDDHAVVFYHQDGDPASMREAFFVNEGGRWKLRRFLGKRDSFRLMQKVVVSKEAAGIALDADEAQFKRDPAGYAAWKRRQMLTESGAFSTPQRAGGAQ